jgi:squalene synthase HpnC
VRRFQTPTEEPVHRDADAAALRAREAGENFPIAVRLLPKDLRESLHAVYGVARTIDDIGDAAPGDRLAALDEVEWQIHEVWAGRPVGCPALERLRPVVVRHRLTIDPFLALVEANRIDQARSSYPTWSDLRHYCAYSADPVGRIVLEVLGATGPDRVALSDDVCTALQVLEHCQDVAEDRRHGRTYLPLDDLALHRVEEVDLDATATSQAVRAVVAHQVDRAEALLRRGAPLAGTLRGAGRVTVAGYIGGGFATVDALRRVDYDVLAVAARPRRRDVLRHTLGVLVGRR